VLNVLFIGDIVGRPGRQAIRELLPELKSRHAIDLVIANGENAAGGIGLTPDVADDLLFYGVDVLTSGNHIWKKRGIEAYLDETPQVLRPANYPGSAPGRGVYVADTARGRVAVINLLGRVFMPPIECPFQVFDRLFEQLDPDVKTCIVDFHAEATSEKQAFGWYADGKASLVAGTHTHVQTADERILPNGAGYLTDVGMTGAMSSVIGMNREIAIRRLITGIPEQFKVAKKNIQLQGVTAQIEIATGKCKKISRIVSCLR